MRQIEEMRLALAVENMAEAARARDREIEMERQHEADYELRKEFDQEMGAVSFARE